MTPLFLLKGILLGFCIAAPVGPIGLLCIRRTLQYGRLSGLFTGLGAAVADTLYGIVAAFGLTYISHFLIAGKLWLQLIGGLFLLYLGIKTYFTKPQNTKKSISHQTLVGDFFSTLILILTNPITILAFIAIFAGLGLPALEGDTTAAWNVVLGVFIGSTLWWLILSEGVTLFRHKVSEKIMLWINRGAGILIGGFGITALVISVLEY